MTPTLTSSTPKTAPSTTGIVSCSPSRRTSCGRISLASGSTRTSAFWTPSAVPVPCWSNARDSVSSEQAWRRTRLYIFALPATLPIDARLPEQEAAGRQALRAAGALVRASHLPLRAYLLPSRSFADTIVRVAEREDVDVIVAGVGPRRRLLGDGVGATARMLLGRAPCPVILVGPTEAGPASSSMGARGADIAAESVLDLPLLETWQVHPGAETWR